MLTIKVAFYAVVAFAVVNVATAALLFPPANPWRGPSFLTSDGYFFVRYPGCSALDGIRCSRFGIVEQLTERLKECKGTCDENMECARQQYCALQNEFGRGMENEIERATYENIFKLLERANGHEVANIAVPNCFSPVPNPIHVPGPVVHIAPAPI